MTYSKAELKSNGNRVPPCFKPFLIENMSHVCLPGPCCGQNNNGTGLSQIIVVFYCSTHSPTHHIRILLIYHQRYIISVTAYQIRHYNKKKKKKKKNTSIEMQFLLMIKRVNWGQYLPDLSTLVPCPPSLLYNSYWVSPESRATGCGNDNPAPSCTEVEYG